MFFTEFTALREEEIARKVEARRAPEGGNCPCLAGKRFRLHLEGQFAPGSMLPKVEASVRFVRSGPGREALITLLEKAQDGILGKTGTRFTA